MKTGWSKDPKTGKKSVTLTVFVWCTFVVMLKYLVSGISYKEFATEKESGVDVAAIIGAVGAIYAGRKHTDKDKDKDSKDDIEE